jgi:hypothetical protein
MLNEKLINESNPWFNQTTIKNVIGHIRFWYVDTASEDDTEGTLVVYSGRDQGIYALLGELGLNKKPYKWSVGDTETKWIFLVKA